MIMEKAVDLLWQFGFFFGGVVTAMAAALTCVILIIHVASTLAFPHQADRRFLADVAGLLFMLTVSAFASIQLLEMVKF